MAKKNVGRKFRYSGQVYNRVTVWIKCIIIMSTCKLYTFSLTCDFIRILIVSSIQA